MLYHNLIIKICGEKKAPKESSPALPKINNKKNQTLLASAKRKLHNPAPP